MLQSSERGGNERTMTDTTFETTAPTLQDLGPAGATPSGTDLSLVLDVPVELAVEIGRTTMTIRQTMALAPGSVVVLDRMAGEPVDLLVNGQTIARGEVVAIDEEFGLRITHVVSPKRRLDAAA